MDNPLLKEAEWWANIPQDQIFSPALVRDILKLHAKDVEEKPEKEDRYVPKLGDVVTAGFLVGNWRVINAPPAEARWTKTTIENDDGIKLMVLWSDLEKVEERYPPRDEPKLASRARFICRFCSYTGSTPGHNPGCKIFTDEDLSDMTDPNIVQ
jgi:hypothetical protein